MPDHKTDYATLFVGALGVIATILPVFLVKSKFEYNNKILYLLLLIIFICGLIAIYISISRLSDEFARKFAHKLYERIENKPVYRATPIIVSLVITLIIIYFAIAPNLGILLNQNNTQVADQPNISSLGVGSALIGSASTDTLNELGYQQMNNGEAAYNNSDIIGAESDYLAAINYFEESVNVQNNSGGRSGLGWAYYDLGNDHIGEKVANEYYQKVISNCTDAIALDANCYNAYENRGSAEYRLGLKNDAISDYNYILENDKTPKDINTTIKWARQSRNNILSNN